MKLPKIEFSFGFLAVLAAIAALLVLPACASVSPEAEVAAAVRAVGQAGGAAILTKNPSPDSIANYEALIPKVAGYMQGKMTPANFHQLVTIIKANTTLTAGQAAALGALDSLGDSFQTVAANTIDGAIVDLQMKQLAAGMAAAVGQVTGTDYVVPPSS